MTAKHTSVFQYLVLAASLLGLSCGLISEKAKIDNYTSVSRLPKIHPDYAGAVIPPNIAPLNFKVNEPGTRYCVKICSTEGDTLELAGASPTIKIPMARWKKILELNRGQELHIDVYVESATGNWQRFDSIVNQIARENIDSFLVYRLIEPFHIMWKRIGIYQRNLESYDETTVLHNRPLDRACINCHNFANNSPDNMIIHMRHKPGIGMLLVHGEEAIKVDTRTKFSKSAAAYASWHPNAKLLAFSVNKVWQFFHTVGEVRDVYDSASDLLLYDVSSNTVTTAPDISSPKRMETYPAWAPDGRYLYFCSAPEYDSTRTLQEQYRSINYDLMRISYDPDSGKWGNLETMLSAQETGKSITHPRISPDGRNLLFCMADYGCFPVYHPSSDLYLMDLFTGQYHKPDINSDRAESYHSWSSNSRWFVFSSKRDNGVTARPYLCYLDEAGKAHKPFVLPQEDAESYETSLRTYNLPELIKEPVKIRPQELTRAAVEFGKVLVAKLDPKVNTNHPVEAERTGWMPAP